MEPDEAMGVAFLLANKLLSEQFSSLPCPILGLLRSFAK